MSTAAVRAAVAAKEELLGFNDRHFDAWYQGQKSSDARNAAITTTTASAGDLPGGPRGADQGDPARAGPIRGGLAAPDRRRGLPAGSR